MSSDALTNLRIVKNCNNFIQNPKVFSKYAVNTTKGKLKGKTKMGMSASQARLLTLTSRLHDIELKAQNIEAQKIALATQKDGLYQEYCDALDAKAFKINIGTASNKNLIDANFNSLCGYYDGKLKDYTLIDNKTNLLLVNKETEATYKQFRMDKYAFALAMMGVLKSNAGYDDIGKEVEREGYNDEDDWQTLLHGGEGGSYTETSVIAMTPLEEAIYNSIISSGTEKSSTLKAKYEAVQEANDKESRADAMTKFREELMKQGGAQMYCYLASQQGVSDPEFDMAEFNHYVHLWEAIDEAGGCTVIDKQYEGGEDGTKWFKDMVESGLITIRAYGDSANPKGWSDTSFATSTNYNFLQEVNDETNVKKAEAKYEHELNIINKKDTKFDTELSKLETERTAITTEMDSIKKVRNDNEERTFGIFS